MQYTVKVLANVVESEAVIFAVIHCNTQAEIGSPDGFQQFLCGGHAKYEVTN